MQESITENISSTCFNLTDVTAASIRPDLSFTHVSDGQARGGCNNANVTDLACEPLPAPGFLAPTSPPSDVA